MIDLKSNGTPPGAATCSPASDTNLPPSVFATPADAARFVQAHHVRRWHGGVPQHGCPGCPYVPCWCGHEDGVCPQAGEHRRDHMGSETSWRENTRPVSWNLTIREAA